MPTWRGMRVIRIMERPDMLAYQLDVIDPSDNRRKVFMVRREELEASMGVHALSSVAAMAQYQSDIQESNMSGLERRRIEEEAHHLHRGAPSVVREAFSPSELWELMHVRGLPHGEIERQAMRTIEDRRQRERRLREMERMIDPPMYAMPDFARESLLSSEAIREMARRAFGMDSSMFREDEPKNKMPEYSEEKFDSMGKEPVVKEIMAGAVQLTKEQRAERIKLHLQKV